MPLIALDILEGKIRELTLEINRLKEENSELKEKLSAGMPGGEVSPEIIYELEKMKKLAARYKNERTELYTKIAGAVKKIDSIRETKSNG